jgi:hypothetical protein
MGKVTGDLGRLTPRQHPVHIPSREEMEAVFAKRVADGPAGGPLPPRPDAPSAAPPAAD